MKINKHRPKMSCTIYARVARVVCLLLVLGGARGAAKPEAQESEPVPSSLRVLSELGKREGASIGAQLDSAFWGAFDAQGPAYLRFGERVSAYVALMRLIDAHAAGSRDVDIGRITDVLEAVLGWGLLSDYLAVCGAIEKVKIQCGTSAFRDPRWQRVLRRVTDVVPFFRNEFRQVDIPTDVALELERLYVTLYASRSLEEFDSGLRRLDTAMQNRLEVGDPVALHFFQGPSLLSVAKVLYRMRTLQAIAVTEGTGEPSGPNGGADRR